MNRRARRPRPPRAWPSSCFSHPPCGGPRTTVGQAHSPRPRGEPIRLRGTGRAQTGGLPVLGRGGGAPLGKTLSFFPFVAFSLNVYFPPRSMNWNMWGFNLVSPWFTWPAYQRGKSLLVDDKKKTKLPPAQDSPGAERDTPPLHGKARGVGREIGDGEHSLARNSAEIIP